MEKKKMGAPAFPYHDDIANEICRLVSISTCGLSKILSQNPHLPGKDVIYTWRAYRPDFADKYMQAKAAQAQLLADEVLEISDDSVHDEVLDERGNWKLNTEYVARSKLRIHTRQWLAGKLQPKIYGDKVFSVQTDDTIKNEVKERVKKAKKNPYDKEY